MRKKAARKNPESRAELLGPALLIAALAAAACRPMPGAGVRPGEVRAMAFSCAEAAGRIEVVMRPGGRAEYGEPGGCPDAVRFMAGEKMNINTAGERALMMIPGIGTGTAARILEFRESSGGFAHMEEVMSMPELSGPVRRGLENWTDVK